MLHLTHLGSHSSTLSSLVLAVSTNSASSVFGTDLSKVMITTLNKATSIQITMYAIFLVKSFHSFHCQVCIIYNIQLYKIIVIAKATTKDNSSLVAFTITDGPFCAPIQPVVISISNSHSITCFHTVSTCSHKSIVVCASRAGFISCMSKSLRNALEIHQKKKGRTKSMINQYHILFFICLKTSFIILNLIK